MVHYQLKIIYVNIFENTENTQNKNNCCQVPYTIQFTRYHIQYNLIYPFFEEEEYIYIYIYIYLYIYIYIHVVQVMKKDVRHNIGQLWLKHKNINC